MQVVILAAARTPVGSFGKSLASVPVAELGATAIKGCLSKGNKRGGYQITIHQSFMICHTPSHIIVLSWCLA